MSLQQVYIGSYAEGLQSDKKPYMLSDQAWSTLENAYVWRERVKKREAIKLLGRLRRLLLVMSLGTLPGTGVPFNLFNQLIKTGPITGVTNANPAEVTSVAHELLTGQIVKITGVTGIENLGPPITSAINDKIFTITVTGANTFTLDGLNTLAPVTGYGGGGTWETLANSINTGDENAEIECGSIDIKLGAGATLREYQDLLGDGRLIRIDTNYNSAITAIVAGATTVVTIVGHTYVIGDVVLFQDVGGMTEINDLYGTITATAVNQITVNINSTTFTPYTLGGNAFFVAGNINYITGDIVLNYPGASTPASVAFGYFPNLPAMGIWQRDINDINFEPTIFFDQKYAYIFVGGGFQEVTPGILWNSGDSDFFWATNYRGVTPDIKLFFETNFISDTDNPMRYFDGATWTTFAPLVSAASNLYSALILIPYYGRLLALNVWEGPTAGGPVGAANIQNRCRFSQIGDPTQLDAWRSDIFGKGGFIDAPTNEAIMSAIFYKNTLIVFFERSTWQLRYVGEYGLPFLWERISSDYGSESTNSTILFDQGVLAVGDRAIVSSTGTNVSRIDEQIPDLVFLFRNAFDGVKRVHGVRDYKRELAFWCYSDSSIGNTFPNRVLVFNYRNNTFAIFRDNVTCFGLFQPSTDAVTWDRTDVFWDDAEVTWTDPDSQSQFANVVSGNQQGFIHEYGYTSFPQPSLTIEDIDLTVTPIIITSPNHNLETGDIIFIKDLHFVDGLGAPLATDLNDNFYRVSPIDEDTFQISFWDGDNYANNFAFTPVTTATYIGCGTITLIYRLNIVTKDFNPYASKGTQLKLSYIDFLASSTLTGSVTVNLYCNASLAVQGNLLVGNTQSETFLTSPYYATTTNNRPVSDYSWHRFFATSFGQYIRIQITYDETLMNTKSIHEQDYELFGMNLYVRPGGKTVF